MRCAMMWETQNNSEIFFPFCELINYNENIDCVYALHLCVCVCVCAQCAYLSVYVRASVSINEGESKNTIQLLEIIRDVFVRVVKMLEFNVGKMSDI